MANSLTTRTANIVFNTKGVNAILNYQKQLVKDKQKQLDIQERLVKSMNGTETNYAKEVKALSKITAELKKLEKEEQTFKSDLNAVTSTINNMGEASPKAINKLNSALARMSKNMGSMTAEAKQKFDALVGAIKPVTEALSQKFQKGFSDMMAFKPHTATWAELNNYVKEYIANGRVLAEVSSNESKAFADMGAKATQAKVQMGLMDGSLKALSADADPTRIREYIKAWKEIQNFQGASDRQKAWAGGKIDKAQAQLANANANMLTRGTGTTAEMKTATAELQKYMETTKLSKAEIVKFNEAIQKGQQNMKASNMSFFTKQMKNVSTLSKDALAENKKYWQSMVDGAKEGSSKLATYQAQLEKVIAEEKVRANNAIRTKGMNALTGVTDGTTSGIKRSIDELAKLRSIASQNGEAKLIEQIDQRTRQLNQDLVSAQENVKLANQYISQTANGGAFKGTIADLEKVKSGLQDMRKHLRDAGDAKGVVELDARIIQADNDIRTAGIDATKLNAAIRNPQGEASLKVLQVAYDKLKAEISAVGISQQQFNEKAAQMKSIKGRIDELNKSFKMQNTELNTNKTLLEAFGTNLRNIILHYVGLQMVFMRIINTFKDVFKLSDQMTNVQKVTGMTGNEVTRLVKELQSLDTRTSTEQLMQFAEQAGKLGIFAKQGVQGIKQFAEMGERISRTLGEDAGGAQAIADLVKINDILGTSQEVIKRTGNEATALRDTLDATGSSILNVGNNSAASYAAVMNYVARLGGIAGTVHMSVQEVVALGGALDALKMPAEAGATAMSQFIAAIQRRTDAMARAAKLDVPEFRELASKDMMSAVKALLNQIREGKASAQDLMDAMTGRSKTNVNIRNSLNLLSSHMDLLNSQLRYAKEGFDSAFGGKTAGDIQVIMSALRDNGLDATLNSINGLFAQFTAGTKSIDDMMVEFSNYKGSSDILRNSLQNVFGALNRVKEEGNLTKNTIKDLATATDTMSIMEQEFARVNENAAGKMERLGNAIKEQIVNSSAVSAFQSIASSIMKFVLWLNNGTTAARLMGSALIMLSTAFIATRSGIQAIVTAMKEWIAVNIVAHLSNMIRFILLANARFGLLGGTIVTFKRLWVGLVNVLKANPWIALTTAIVGLVYYIKSATDETTKFSKATAEARESLEAEVRQAALLFAQLNNLTKGTSEYSRVMSEINNKYSTLIGFMISEKSSAYELANAYALVNARLREKAQLQLNDSLIQSATKEASEKVGNNIKTLSEVVDRFFKNNPEKSAKFQARASQIINEELAKNSNRTEEELLKAVKARLKGFNVEVRSQDAEGNEHVSTKEAANTVGISNALKGLISSQKELVTAADRVGAYVTGNEMANNKASAEANKNRILSVNADVNKIIKDFGRKVSEWKTDDIERLLNSMKEILKDPAYERSAKGSPNATEGLKQFKGWVNIFDSELKRRNPNLYGSQTFTTDPTKMTVEQLRKAHSNAKTAMSMAKDGVVWSSMGLDIPGLIDGMTEAAAREIIDSYDESLQEQAKKKHINLEGDGFNHGSHKDKSNSPKFEESDSALAELDRYYSWLDEQEKARVAKNEITQAEYERRQLKNEGEHLQKRADLRAYFDGKDRKEFIAWWDSIEELDSVSWGKINNEWAEADDKKRKENMRSRQKDLTEIQNMYAKSIQEINKLLLESNPTAKVLQSLTDELDNLDLLTGNMFKDADIVQQLRPIMNNIANMTETELMARLKALPSLADILTGDDATVAKKLQAYILKLTEGSENYVNALRKEAQKEKKNIDFQYDSNETKAGMTNNLSQLQQGSAMASNLQSLGMGSDVVSSEAKLKVAQQEYELAMNKYQFELKAYDLELQKIEALLYELRIRESLAMQEGNYDEANQAREERAKVELQYEDLKQKAMFATEETRNQVAEKQKAVDEAEHEVINNKLNYLREYMSSIEQFGTSMTEAAFGTKEDRQKAAKELLKSVLETTKKIMMAKLEELIFEKSINQQKVIANQTMNSQITSNAGNAIMSQMTGTVAQAEVDTVSGIASGGAKTVGQMGVWGIPLIAVIGAVLGALIAAVMAQFNKSKTKVTGSAGKLSTGMLTYAEGRYPTYADGTMQVQGNDGRSYNAVVKPNLTTGEYNRPHLGIVGERGAELIVDSPTFRNIKQNAPWILKGIYDMKRFGTTTLNHRIINRAMQTLGNYPTHAQGNIAQALGSATVPEELSSGSTNNQQLLDTLTLLTSAITTLQSEGVRGYFNVYGDDGLVNTYDKGKRFLTSVGK